MQRDASGKFINFYNDGLSYRERRLVRLYGITLEEYEKKLSDQLSGCSICNRTIEQMGRALHIDHDHKTKQVRDLVCGSCNLILGLANDEPERLLKSYLYLIKHKRLNNY